MISFSVRKVSFIWLLLTRLRRSSVGSEFHDTRSCSYRQMSISTCWIKEWMSNIPGWVDEAGAAGAGAGAAAGTPNEGTNSFAPRLGFHEAALGLSESFEVACDSESWFWLIVACVVRLKKKRLPEKFEWFMICHLAPPHTWPSRTLHTHTHTLTCS